MVATVSATGTINLYNLHGSTDLAVDVAGWYALGS